MRSVPNLVQIFSSINISLPVDAVYRRLGYKRGITKVDEREKEKIERHIEYAASLVSLKGAGLRVPLERVDPALVVLGTGTDIKSAKLAGFLKGCKETLFIGSTAGSAVMNAIRGDIEGGDMARGVVIDAVASEMADAALDWIVGFLIACLPGRAPVSRRGAFLPGMVIFCLKIRR